MPIEFSQLRAGDRVTIVTPLGQLVTGTAQRLLTNPAAGTVVLNMGGPHGRPAVCTSTNFVKATRRNP